MRRACLVISIFFVTSWAWATNPFVLLLGSWGNIAGETETALAAAVNPGQGHLNLISAPNGPGSQELTLNFYSGPAVLAFSKPTAISGTFVSGQLGVSPNGSMYVLGQSTTGTNRRLTLACVTPTGIIKWSRQLFASTTQLVRGYIAVDSSDSVVVAYATGTSPNVTVTVMRLKESNGGTLWTRNLSSTQNPSSLMVGAGVAVLPALAGTSPAFSTRVRGLKLTNGSLAFDKSYDAAQVGRVTSGGFNPVSQRFDLVGNSSSPEPSYVYSLNSAGDLKWVSALPDSVTQLPVHDGSGRIYTLSATSTTAYTMVCHSPDGQLLYQTAVPNLSAIQMPGTYGVTSDGVCYLMHEQIVNNQEVLYISEFSPTGQLNWQSSAPAPWAASGLKGIMTAVLAPSPETGGTLYMTATVTESGPARDVGNFYYGSP